jgi:hypothetical protein
MKYQTYLNSIPEVVTKMIKESGRTFDKDSPADQAALDELYDRLEEEETKKDIEHLLSTVRSIEESLEMIKDRDFNTMSQEELLEVKDMVENLNQFKMELNVITDEYLGQGALVYANLPEDMVPPPPKDFVGWGSRKPGDPDFGLLAPTIPLAEASAESSIVKNSWVNPTDWWKEHGLADGLEYFVEEVPGWQNAFNKYWPDQLKGEATDVVTKGIVGVTPAGPVVDSATLSIELNKYKEEGGPDSPPSAERTIKIASAMIGFIPIAGDFLKPLVKSARANPVVAKALSKYIQKAARSSAQQGVGTRADLHIINELTKVANELDNRGLAREADKLDYIILNM